MARINLLYATKVNLGGWATFTVHLYHLLKNAGHDVYLYKVGNRTEGFQRPFADHGIDYQNYSAAHLADLSVQKQYCIIAALGKHYADAVQPLLAAGAGIVVHDTAESTNRMDVKMPWVIRKSLRPLFDNAVFIRHPYVPQTDLRRDMTPMKNRSGYVATSRVDFDKNTRMILDANRLGAGVDIVGFENRLYTRFKICPDYPEWVQSKGDHPRSGVASFERLTKARGMVDLTDIKGDGGGTQYTFLEAWDAGCVPIIGSWWIKAGDDMKPMTNCFTVGSAEELVKLTKRWPVTARDLVEAGRLRLKKFHGPSLAPEIMGWLEAVKGAKL
jgi:hypothetical protein